MLAQLSGGDTMQTAAHPCQWSTLIPQSHGTWVAWTAQAVPKGRQGHPGHPRYQENYEHVQNFHAGRARRLHRPPKPPRQALPVVIQTTDRPGRAQHRRSGNLKNSVIQHQYSLAFPLHPYPLPTPCILACHALPFYFSPSKWYIPGFSN